MAKITLSDVTTISGINANFQALEDELNNKVFYRDSPVGEPNTLNSDVDANGKNITNANDVYVDNELFLQGLPISDAIDAAAGGLVADAQAAATSAAASANTATTSANNAAASYDSFDDRYLGPKSTPPTLDNDGQPLLVGALYWDTTLSPGGTFPATNITFSPSGNISATLVQTAIEELDAEKAKLNGDVTKPFFSSSFTGPLTGTATNDNASAGYVGEYVSNSASGVVLTTITAANAVSISLTAGDWDVWGVAQYTLGGGTTMSAFGSGVSTVSATLGPFQNSAILQGTTTNNSFGPINQSTPVIRLSLASTLTVYLVGVASFSGGTNTLAGFLQARRVR